MKLTCYTLEGETVDIRPAPRERDWIDQTHNQFARHCLPLVTANAHGWEICLQDGCWVKWSGGIRRKDLKVLPDSKSDRFAASHFGHGIMTFTVKGLLRTEPHTNLWVTGPVNRFKDGAQAMSGLLETDWMPFLFTMNWQITRKRKWIRFEKGEPIAHVFPVPRGMVDDVDPVKVALASEPELNDMVTNWRNSRKDLLKALRAGDEEARARKIKKQYYKGENPDGTPGVDDHQVRVQPKPFRAD